MKKVVLCLLIAIFIFLAVIFKGNKVTMSNSETFKNNNKISELISEYSTEYGREFKLATKEIEKRIFGEWQVGDTIGFSLKYDITGGALDEGKLFLSKELFRITTLTPVFINVDGKIKTSGKFEDYSTEYKSPVFAYYQETLEQMKYDDFLDRYSGVRELEPDTIGTVIVVMALKSNSQEDYEHVYTKFIIINDFLIAVRQSSFYQLQKID